jgi:hypothetical protein
VENIAEATPEPHATYWYVGTVEAAQELARLEQTHWLDGGDSWGNRLNKLLNLTSEPYLFCAADDVKFHPGWLTAAHKCMTGVEGVVMVNDMKNPQGTNPLVSRHYIDTESGCVDEPRVIIHPGYAHAYSDTELIYTAMSRGRHAYCPESVVEHLHPGAGKGEWDAVYAVGQASMAPGFALFQSRQHLWGG